MLNLPPILAIGFMAPWIMGAAAGATSVPIIIHLLNKRRFKIMFWAAMDFLLAAQRRNARRLQFQRWLLLLLRITALLVLGAAIAQMFLGCERIGGLLGEDRVMIVLIDDSYSMGYTDPAAKTKDSHLDQAKKLVIDWMQTLQSSDRVAIVRTSTGAAPVMDKPTPDKNVLRQLIQAMPVSDGGTDIGTALGKAATIAQEARKTGANCQVLLVTDLSYSSIAYGRPEGPHVKEQLQKAADELRKIASLRVADVGADDQANKGITTLKTKRPVVVANSSTKLIVGVTNGTKLEQANLEVSVLVDGVAAGKEKLPRIAPGEEIRRELEVRFKTKGRHVVEARLDPDLLAADDVRRIIVDAEEQAPVLIIDGDPGDKNFGTTNLQVALGWTAANKADEEFGPVTKTELDLPQENLDPYDAVILSDIGDLAPKTAEHLKAYAEAGGLVVLFPGPRMSPDAINKSLGEGGVKLLPASVIQLVKPELADQSGVLFDQKFDHPFLDLLAAGIKKQEKTGLESVRTMQYFKLSLPVDGASEVVLRFQSVDRPGAEGDPAVVTRKIGKGRVVMFASSAGQGWTTFPFFPGYKEFVQEVMFHAISRGSERYTLNLNDQIYLPREEADPGMWDGPRNQKVAVEVTVDDKEHKSRLTSGPLTMAGLYSPPGAKTPMIAVNVDDNEADIRHLTAAQFADALHVNTADILSNPTKVDTLTASGGAEGEGKLPRYLLLTALILFGLETLFARMFSVYH